jgi:hypothetical protein
MYVSGSAVSGLDSDDWHLSSFMMIGIYYHLKGFVTSSVADPGCLSRIRIPDPTFLVIPDPGSGSRIPDPTSKSKVPKKT